MIQNLIIAHRGESYDAPENTLSAINLAWERGAEAVEIDVQLTKDNKIVVFHDIKTNRIGNRYKKVKKQTLKELLQLDAGIYKGFKWKGEKIPTLDEVFNTIPVNRKIIIEIKCGVEIVPYLKENIYQSGLELDQIEIIGFNLKTVSVVKSEIQGISVLWLADLDYTWFTKILSPPVEKLIKLVKVNKLDGLDVWAGKLLDSNFVRKVKSTDLKLYVWTVDNPQQAKILFEWGVDGITTNRAEWLKQKLTTM